MIDLDALDKLHAAATPGEWQTYNVQNPDFRQYRAVGVQLMGPDCWDLADCSLSIPPAPEEPANAALIVAARNSLPAMIAEIRELRAENARLREANGILEDGLQEVGDDYPGSSCQEWCQHQIKQARAALGEPQ